MTLQLSPEVLTPILREHFGESVECVALRRGEVGNGQETWFFQMVGPQGSRGLVLRRTAVDGTMSYTDRVREFETMSLVATTGLPVPRVHWCEGDGSRLERPYFVMDRLPGVPLGRADRSELAAVAHQLGGHLARLHELGSDGPSAAEATRAELAAWKRRYLDSRSIPVPLVGALLAWLEHNLPPLPGEAVLNWGDPGPHNLLVEGGQITALLDWEMSHPGHPLDDLGGAVWACLGHLDPEQVVAGYETVSGRRVDRDLLSYFEVLACVTRSIAIEIGVTAFVEGRISAPAVAGLGLELLAANLERAALAAGWEAVEAPELPLPHLPDPGLPPSPAQVDRGVVRLIASELLPATQDTRVRRLLKNAAAVLETAADRVESEAAIGGWRAAARESLLRELGAAGVSAADLEMAAMAVEADDALAPLRPRVRRHLLQELAAERRAFGALRRLYGPGAAAAPLLERSQDLGDGTV